MAFNTLSGSISPYQIIASGSFSGSFVGDGTDLLNVNHFNLHGDTAAGRVVLFKTINGDTHLEGDSTFYFDTTSNILNVSKLTASSDLQIGGAITGSDTFYVNPSNKRVGIGTSTPSGKLEVISGNDANGTIVVRSGNAGQYSKISIGTNANKATIGVPGADDTFFTNTAAGDLVLRADDNNSKVHIGVSTSGPAEIVVSDGGVIFGNSELITNVSASGVLQVGTHITASGQLIMPNISSGSLAGGGSYLGLSANGTVVLTASSGGGGGGGGAVTAVANGADNRIATFSSTTALNGEANLSFDGSILSVQGGLVFKRRQITSTITASSSDYFIGISASSNLQIRLPDASTLSSGQTFVFKDEAGNAGTHYIKINASGSQTIDGQALVVLGNPFAAINLYTNGSNKFFIF